MTKKHKEKNQVAVILSWSLVLFWMGVIYWFSSQPAEESVQWSLGAMEVGRQIATYWQWVGIFAFIVVYHVFLVWLSKIKSGWLAKLCLFFLFLMFSFAFVYVLFNEVMPRVGSSGLFQMNRWVIHRYLRKYAHFFIYLFLGGVIKNALTVSNVKGWKAFAIAILISILYAVFDEIHQLFVPGRIPLVLDVVIDTAGAAVGVAIYSVLSFLFQLTKRKVNA